MRRAAEQDGFTVLGLLVLVAVINIGLGVAATSWVTIDKRAKEAELIWRGQQYMRAIACHQQQTGGLPDDLADLVDAECIRSLYPDPMSDDGEWYVVRENDPAVRQDFSAAGDIDRLPPEADEGGRRGRRGGRGGGGRGGGPGGLQTDAIDQSLERFRELREELSQRFSSNNGIVGVKTQATGDALRKYEDKTKYEDWLFVVSQFGLQ